MKEICAILFLWVVLIVQVISGGSPDVDAIKSQADALSQYLNDIHRDLHENPELKYEEKYTSRKIKAALKELGIKFTGGWGKNAHAGEEGPAGGFGVVADIGTGKSPCVALRADMDGLEITEMTDVPYKSKRDGMMHACGHDAHTAMLLGAAKILKSMENEIPGTVRLIFQPAEEGGAGAYMMIEEGVLTQEPAVQRVFAMHVYPNAETGTLNGKRGIMLAGADSFDITFSGEGGHAAMPYLTIDPITAAVHTVTSLNSFTSKAFGRPSAMSGLINVTEVDAGTTHNVTPSTARIGGTFRCFNEEKMDKIRKDIERIATNTAEAHQCTSEIEFSLYSCPPTINDREYFDFISETVGPLAKGGEIEKMPPFMGAEDFGFYNQHVPSVILFLGTHDEDSEIPTDYPLHSDKFAIDEAVLPTGSFYYTTVALFSLEENMDENTRDTETGTMPHFESTFDSMAQKEKLGDRKPQKEKVGDRKPQNEKLGDGKPQKEKVDDRKPQNEKLGDRKAQNEKAGDRKPQNEKLGDAKAQNEKPTDGQPKIRKNKQTGESSGSETDEEKLTDWQKKQRRKKNKEDGDQASESESDDDKMTEWEKKQKRKNTEDNPDNKVKGKKNIDSQACVPGSDPSTCPA